MATCDINTLLQSGRCFASCGGGGISQVMRLALLKQMLLAVSPGADTSVNTLMASGKCFTCLTPGQQRIVKLQLLCEILDVAGGGGGSGDALLLETGDNLLLETGDNVLLE